MAASPAYRETDPDLYDVEAAMRDMLADLPSSSIRRNTALQARRREAADAQATRRAIARARVGL